MKPSLADVIREPARSEAGKLRAIEQGEVLSYDHAAKTCSVQVLNDDLVDDGRGGRVQQKVAPLNDVPVLQIKGNGFSMVVTLKPGDRVTLLFNDSSLERLVTTGQGGHPGDARRHDLQDAVALPFTLAAPSSHTSAEHWSLGADGGPRVYFKPTTIHIGAETASHSAALAELVENEVGELRNTVNSFVSKFNAHTHAVAGAAASAILPVQWADPPATVGNMGSATVKVQE